MNYWSIANPTKEDKEAYFRALDERDEDIALLDSMQNDGAEGPEFYFENEEEE